MSAVAGIVHLDGGQALPRDLEPVLESMRHWGRDPQIESTEGACLGALGATARNPVPCLNGTAIITSAARLDTRDELADALQIGVSEHSTLSDAGLVVRAFERWGDACVDHLNGDWSMAIWWPSTRRLFLARDHFGNTGMYYARIGQRVAFASDINALLALPDLPRSLNDTRIASLLVGGGVDSPESTVYRDVSRLPPAHTVSITPGEERLVRYWRVEDTPDGGPATTPERAELLRDTIRAAVRSRLPDGASVGSMLSGGLDSGAVTALAAEYLQGQGRRLTAFTSVPAFSMAAARPGTGHVDEGATASDVVRSFDM